MNVEEMRARLNELGQEHLLEGWESRSAEQQERLVKDVAETDLSIVSRFRELVEGGETVSQDIEPAPYLSLEEREGEAEAASRGMSLAREGRTAFLTVAGGQGSRLGYDGPKGMFPVTPVREASLFQVFAEKLLGFCRQENARIPWYIMTSPQNHEPTRDYFRSNGFFGIPEDDVVFFPQGMLPTMSEEGKLLLAADGGLFKNPDGHGGLVTALQRQKILQDMQGRGVDYVFYFQVDNPLVVVPDPVFLGYHVMQDAEVAVKVIEKTSPEEKLGVIALRDGVPCIIEYSDLSEENMYAKEPDGRLRFRQGSPAIHIFSVSFLAREGLELPLHLARKKVEVMDPASGDTMETTGVKFERFIFDTIPISGRILFFETVREDEFSPVKNAEGPDSPETSRRDQIRKAARMLEEAGLRVPRDSSGEPKYALEISPLFAWNGDALQAKLSDADTRIDEDKVFV